MLRTSFISSLPVSGNWPSSRGSSGWSGAAGTTSSYYKVPSNINAVKVAHVVLGALAVLLILPGGAIFVRLFGEAMYHGPWIHGAIQIFGYLMYCSAAALGIWMARSFSLVSTLPTDSARMLTMFQVSGDNQYLHPKLYHPIIGMILLALVFFQPFTELANHLIRKRCPQRYPNVHRLGYVHIWFGRLLLILAIVNGGLGFAFADQIPGNTWSKAPRILYGVAATVVVFTYVVIVTIWGENKGKRKMSQTSDRVRDEEMQRLSHHSVGEGEPGPSEHRPQTAQTAQTTQTDSTTGVGFKSGAL